MMSMHDQVQSTPERANPAACANARRARAEREDRAASKIAAAASLIMLASQAIAQDVSELSIEELMNEPVTLVGKKETRLFASAAAVSVVTQDDIRRLGITSVPEALRLVPGFNVARIDASHWAVSARGFNLQYANKLLVLVDGRSVYTPSFGGVYWNAQDLPLDQIERIEVIRGPGATLWGANAVNGVINIISKQARDTQGAHLSASLGTEDRPSFDARYGGELGREVHYRGYVKYFDRAALLDEDGSDAADDWRSVRGGFRADWQPTADTLYTLQGDYFSLDSTNTITEAALIAPFSQTHLEEDSGHGANVLGRFSRTFSERSHLSVQLYLDSFQIQAEQRDTVDLTLEHRFAPTPRHDIVWGAGYRFTTDEMEPSATFRTTPVSRDLHLFTAFVQDEISLLAERLSLTVGSKVEHNGFTGWEVQPSARLLWTPSRRQTVWTAVSHAIGTPPRFYEDSRLTLSTAQPPFSPVIEVAMVPNPDIAAEQMDSYEVGYRLDAANATFDLAAFYNRYDDLPGLVPEAPQFEMSPVPHVVVPLKWYAAQWGHSYGAEASVNWQPRDYWRLTGTYSWLHVKLQPDAAISLGSPAQQASLRSFMTLPHRLELNTALFYVDSVEPLTADGTTTRVPAHLRLDLGILYRPVESLELGVWGQNLLDARHPEFASQNTLLRTEVPRSVLLRATKKF
jgi:iron complex outermembrane recepter protein